VEAEIIVDERGTLAPLRGAIGELVDELTPVARRLECEAELGYASRILEHGPSYLRQRRWMAAGGSLSDVVDGLIRELRTDEPA
jgi:carboxylate-amine ligase